MKINKLLVIASVLLLAGCDSNSSVTSSVSSVESSEVSSSYSSEENIIYSIDFNEEDHLNYKLGISDILIDIEAVGKQLCVGETYTAGISLSGQTDQEFTIKNSNPENIQITKIEGTQKISFVPIRAGDTILEIWSTNGTRLHYRNRICARNKIAQDKIIDYLIETPSFGSLLYRNNEWYGDTYLSSLTFVSEEQGVYGDYDEGTYTGKITFTYEMRNVNPYGTDEYFFVITDFPNYATSLAPTGFFVDYTGCVINLVTIDDYGAALLEMYAPNLD